MRTANLHLGFSSPWICRCLQRSVYWLFRGPSSNIYREVSCCVHSESPLIFRHAFHRCSTLSRHITDYRKIPFLWTVDPLLPCWMAQSCETLAAQSSMRRRCWLHSPGGTIDQRHRRQDRSWWADESHGRYRPVELKPLIRKCGVAAGFTITTRLSARGTDERRWEPKRHGRLSTQHMGEDSPYCISFLKLYSLQKAHHLPSKAQWPRCGTSFHSSRLSLRFRTSS